MTISWNSVMTVKGVVTALALCALGGCGGSSGSDGGAKDLAMPKPDQTMVAPEDLAMEPAVDLTIPFPPDDLTVIPDLARPPDMSSAPPVTVKVGPNNSLTFAPAQVNIKVGGTVLWQWESGGHNVVGGTNGVADNKFCNDNDMNCAAAPTKNAAAMYRHTFKQAGMFPYFCAPHSGAGMTGTVVVQ